MLRVPPNAEFEIDDYTKEWTHDPNSFSFIHARALYGTVADWPLLFREVYKALEPGGWFESVETAIYLECDDGSVPDDATTHRWSTLLDEASRAAGKPFSIAQNVEKWLQSSEFTNVHQVVYKIPVGAWPKDSKIKQIGQFNLLNMLEGAGM